MVTEFGDDYYLEEYFGANFMEYDFADSSMSQHFKSTSRYYLAFNYQGDLSSDNKPSDIIIQLMPKDAEYKGIDDSATVDDVISILGEPNFQGYVTSEEAYELTYEFPEYELIFLFIDESDYGPGLWAHKK